MKIAKLVAFGDSIIKGVVPERSRRTGYALLSDNFTEQCRQRLGIDISNYGKFGGTVRSAQGILSLHLRKLKSADYTLLEYGGNDCNFDWREIASDPGVRHEPHTDLVNFGLNYKEIIDRVRFAGSKPLMLSLPPIVPQRYFEFVTRGMSQQEKDNVLSWLGGDVEYITSWHEMYNIEIFKIAGIMKVPVIDITSAFLSQRGYQRLFCEDGAHPNVEGHKLISDIVCSYLGKVIPGSCNLSGYRSAMRIPALA